MISTVRRRWNFDGFWSFPIGSIRRMSPDPVGKIPSKSDRFPTTRILIQSDWFFDRNRRSECSPWEILFSIIQLFLAYNSTLSKSCFTETMDTYLYLLH